MENWAFLNFVVKVGSNLLKVAHLKSTSLLKVAPQKFAVWVKVADLNFAV